MTNYKSQGKVLNINTLLAQQAGIAAELKKLEPTLEEVKKLNKNAESVAFAILRYKAENGGCTPEELFELQYSASNPEVFASLIVWLERITRSGQVTLNYGPTCIMTLNHGTIVFPYLFIINLEQGLTSALMEDIEAIFSATSTPSNPDDILFRISSNNSCLVIKNIVDGSPAMAYDGGLDVYSGESYISNPLKGPSSIKEILMQMQDITEISDLPVVHKKLFGLF